MVWDNHACLPLRPGDESFLPELSRHRRAGFDVVSVNVYFDLLPPESAFSMLAAFRRWIGERTDEYLLASRVDDLDVAHRTGKLAVVFDVEGGLAVEDDPARVERLYELGVRWMLLAYNLPNQLGGGCTAPDPGLSDLGRVVIDEMERVGMVLCCSHTGHRTAMEALEHSSNPVILSHSNPLALHAHPRNVADDLMLGCARSGGVVNLNGVGQFLGPDRDLVGALVRNIEYAAALVGWEHVGLGLDYVFDTGELAGYIADRPDLFPPGLSADNYPQIGPESVTEIVERLLQLNYTDQQVAGLLGLNNLRVARQVWR